MGTWARWDRINHRRFPPGPRTGSRRACSLHYDLNNKTTCCLTLTVLPLMTSPLQQTLKFWQLLPLLNYTVLKTSPMEFTLHLLFHAPTFLHPIARLANLSLAEDCFPSRLICVSNDFI